MTLWIIFHIYPSALHHCLLQYYISTNCTELDGSCCWREWKRIVTNNLEKHRITHIKHRYIVLSHMQKIKRCNMLQRQECITKHNVQYNTHANKSLSQTHQQTTLTSCSLFTVRTNSSMQSSSVSILMQSSSPTFSTPSTVTVSIFSCKNIKKRWF